MIVELDPLILTRGGREFPRLNEAYIVFLPFQTMSFEKKTVLSFFAAFVVMFLLAIPWNMYVVTRYGFTTISIGKGHPILSYVIFGYVLLAFLMSYLFPRISIDGSWYVKGAKFGVLVAIFWQVPYNLMIHGAFGFPPYILIVDTLWSLVEQGAGSLGIAYVYRK